MQKTAEIRNHIEIIAKPCKIVQQYSLLVLRLLQSSVNYQQVVFVTAISYRIIQAGERSYKKNCLIQHAKRNLPFNKYVRIPICNLNIACMEKV